MKLSLMLFLAISSVMMAIEVSMPTEIKWLYEYDAAGGELPAAAVWKSTYSNPANAVVADGVLKLDNSGTDGYQNFSLCNSEEMLLDPKGDPVVSFRISCLEMPMPNGKDEFPGFFSCGFFGSQGEGKFGASTLVSQNEILFNFGSRIKIPRQELGSVHEFMVVLRREQGAAFIWMDGAYIGSQAATINLQRNGSWGDGSGGVCGKVGVEFVRFGLADISDREVYLPGFKPYVPPEQFSGIIQNEDCTQYYYTPSYPATRKGLEDYLTECYLPEYCQIKEFMLNPQSQRASYCSGVIPTTWRDFQRDADGKLTYRGKVFGDAQQSAFSRMMTLAENGLDAYTIWIELLRKRGISPWISIRMNDVHDATDENSHMHCDLWREHPEFRIAPYRRGDWFSQQLDYARPEVREYMLRLVDELLERYDSDGLELDWMRFCRVFKIGHEVENRHILTEFIQEVRNRCDQAAERRGHPIKIAARVQFDPVDAFNIGFDVQEWCRRRLVDIIIPAPFFDNNWEQCPIELWRSIVGPDVLLAPCLDTSYKPRRDSERISPSSFDNALATYYLAHGADRIYLFNHFGNQHRNMRTLGSLELSAAGERRHVTLYKDDYAYGTLPTYMLPRAMSPGAWFALRMSLGVKPEPGRRAYLFVGSKTAFPTGGELSVRLNSEPISPCPNPGCANFNPSLKAVYAWKIPDGALFDDGNVLEFTNGIGGNITLDWVEIYIEEKE